MIVRDGGQNLAPLLAGAAPWVDEIIVGDTGSEDDSVAVARQHGAGVHHIGWRDDFAWARNQVLNLCGGAWIVVLDADEQLASDDWRDLRTWVAVLASENRVRAGRIATRNYLPLRHSRRGWTPVPGDDPHALPDGAPSDGFVITSKVRVFPNRPEIRFRGAVHETVEASLWDAGVPIVDLTWPVHHFGYLEPRAGKDERYLHLAHLKTTEMPHDAQAWAELAECGIAVGDHNQALVAMERSLLLEPSSADRRLTCGWLLKETGDLDAAEEQLAAVAGLPGSDDLLVAEAAHLRAQLALGREDLHRATVLLAEALRLFPENGHFQNTLGSLNLALGRGDAARRALELAGRLLPHQVEPCLNLAAMYENCGEHELAGEQYAEALRRDPQHCHAAVWREKAALLSVSG